eukprot:60706-Pelagomonas_calceolata.AAC.2
MARDIPSGAGMDKRLHDRLPKLLFQLVRDKHLTQGQTTETKTTGLRARGLPDKSACWGEGDTLKAQLRHKADRQQITRGARATLGR